MSTVLIEGKVIIKDFVKCINRKESNKYKILRIVFIEMLFKHLGFCYNIYIVGEVERKNYYS